MVEQITPNTNIIVHNRIKIPLHETECSYKGRLAKACHLDTMCTPNFPSFERFYLKNYLPNLRLAEFFILFFIILSCTHYFYKNSIFFIWVQIFEGGCKIVTIYKKLRISRFIHLISPMEVHKLLMLWYNE